MRPAWSFSLVSVLSCLALAPAACSDDGDRPDVVGSGAAGSAAGNHDAAGKAGQVAAGAMTSVAGTDNRGAGGTGEGGAGSGSAPEGGVSGAPLGGRSSGDGGNAVLGSSGAAGECAAVVTSHPLSPGVHVTACMPIEYTSNPPSSGEHYPTWADFGVYDFALPRGYWVHNLEHGAVVVTYHCAAGCDADLAKAKAWLAELTPDATCPAGPPRILLVPDPLLDVPWAASAWGFTLRADCFDPDAFSDFFVKHAGQPTAPEAGLCGTGYDFRLEGAETCGAN